MKLERTRQIFENKYKIRENSSSGSRQTDKHNEADAFRNFAKVLKMLLKKLSYTKSK
jgi:hypothetical protein